MEMPRDSRKRSMSEVMIEIPSRPASLSTLMPIEQDAQLPPTASPEAGDRQLLLRCAEFGIEHPRLLARVS